VCDRGWETEEELNEHLEGHISCEIDGCSFSGHPKIVALHVKLQHSTGLFQKIPKSKDQEEIKKWIEERKRYYKSTELVFIQFLFSLTLNFKSYSYFKGNTQLKKMLREK
jgi:hypothetical protein